MKGRALDEVLTAVTKAAEHGMEQTKNMVAAMGKLKLRATVLSGILIREPCLLT